MGTLAHPALYPAVLKSFGNRFGSENNSWNYTVAYSATIQSDATWGVVTSNFQTFLIYLRGWGLRILGSRPELSFWYLRLGNAKL